MASFKNDVLNIHKFVEPGGKWILAVIYLLNIIPKLIDNSSALNGRTIFHRNFPIAFAYLEHNNSSMYCKG